MHLLDRVILANLCVVICHQIDAAYWHEWDMFGLPGGIQLFSLLNLLIFAVLLTGFVVVLQRRPAGVVWSLLIAAGGGLIFLFHAGFALAGFTQFNLPVSIALIVISLPLAIFQVALTFRHRSLFG